jgi:linoleoyl-CoA desaturase
MSSVAEDASTSVQDWKHPRFARRGAFHKELVRRVDAYFEETGLTRRDDPRNYLKTVVILTWMAVSWTALVFGDLSIPAAMLAAVSLGLGVAGAGFSIMHDGGHRAYSSRPWVNRWIFRVIDMLGGSSYMWNYKHNILHHTYSNINGFDDDIDVWVLGRMSEDQAHYAPHRFQHFYMWILYGMLPTKWHMIDDWRSLLTGKIGDTEIVRPKGFDLAVFFGGKIIFFGLVFGIPSLVYPFWLVCLFYLLGSFCEGVALGVVFQLAHCVDNAEFPLPDPTTGWIGSDFAEHQLATTSDFGAGNRLLTWYVGGLNFQVVHHLFPKVTHTRYPALARIVAETAEEFGVPYRSQPTFRSALRSHYRHLKALSVPPALAA